MSASSSSQRMGGPSRRGGHSGVRFGGIAACGAGGAAPARPLGLLEALPKPTVATLHGVCNGAGIELPLYCDLRIAAEDARIALPEVTLGYIPPASRVSRLRGLHSQVQTRGCINSPASP